MIVCLPFTFAQVSTSFTKSIEIADGTVVAIFPSGNQRHFQITDILEVRSSPLYGLIQRIQIFTKDENKCTVLTDPPNIRKLRAYLVEHNISIF